MSLMGLADKCGVMTSSLEQLLAGKVTVGVAGQLNCMSSSLQKFVDGGTSMGLAEEIGVMSSTLQEYRNKVGKDGAIGLLIGLMAAKGA